MVGFRAFLQQLTFINKLMVWLALGMVAFLGYQFLTYRKWQRQYWAAVISDQQGYPARLLRGSLLPTNGDAVKLEDPSHNPDIVSTDDGMTVIANWDYDNAELAAHFQLPPRQLRLAWVSVRERTFYRGEFDLPASRIDSLLAQVRAQPGTGGVFEQLANDLSADTELPNPVPGLTVVVQPQAGGWVGVWLAGRDSLHTSRLGRYRATAYRPNWPEEGRMTGFKTPTAYLDWLTRDEQTTQHYLTPLP